MPTVIVTAETSNIAPDLQRCTVLSPNFESHDGGIEHTIPGLNSLFPKHAMVFRSSLYPLQDLVDSEATEQLIDHAQIRKGAKVAVADLYISSEDLRKRQDGDRNLAEALVNIRLENSIASAQYSVLHTTELLELILSFLPVADLYQSANVCASWKDLITTSPTLRRALFGLKNTSVPPAPEHYSSKPAFVVNPILDSLNLVRACKDSGPFQANINFPARWRTVSALWRDIQVCEPPIRRIFLQSSWLDKYLECDTGVTAGMVADKVELSRVGTLRLFHSM